MRGVPPIPKTFAATRARADQQLAESAPRRAVILKLRARGLSLAQIGREVGLTRQRVHAILKASEAA